MRMHGEGLLEAAAAQLVTDAVPDDHFAAVGEVHEADERIFDESGVFRRADLDRRQAGHRYPLPVDEPHRSREDKFWFRAGWRVCEDEGLAGDEAAVTDGLLLVLEH